MRDSASLLLESEIFLNGSACPAISLLLTKTHLLLKRLRSFCLLPSAPAISGMGPPSSDAPSPLPRCFYSSCLPQRLPADLQGTPPGKAQMDMVKGPPMKTYKTF